MDTFCRIRVSDHRDSFHSRFLPWCCFGFVPFFFLLFPHFFPFLVVGFGWNRGIRSEYDIEWPTEYICFFHALHKIGSTYRYRKDFVLFSLNDRALICLNWIIKTNEVERGNWLMIIFMWIYKSESFETLAMIDGDVASCSIKISRVIVTYHS